MDLEGVRAVFQGVLDRDRLGRQLAQLADRHEARRSGGRPSAALKMNPRDSMPDHDVDPASRVGLEHQVDRLAVGDAASLSRVVMS